MLGQTGYRRAGLKIQGSRNQPMMDAGRVYQPSPAWQRPLSCGRGRDAGKAMTWLDDRERSVSGGRGNAARLAGDTADQPASLRKRETHDHRTGLRAQLPRGPSPPSEQVPAQRDVPHCAALTKSKKIVQLHGVTKRGGPCYELRVCDDGREQRLDA